MLTSKIKQLAAGCCVVFALIMSTAPPAAAHADFESASPGPGAQLETAPDRLVLRFTEEIESFTLTVSGPDGDLAVTLDLDLSDDSRRTLVATFGTIPTPGIYTVQWDVTSAVDGDVSIGGYEFAIGDAVASSQLFGADDTSNESSSNAVLISVVAIAALATLLVALSQIGTKGRVDSSK